MNESDDSREKGVMLALTKEERVARAQCLSKTRLTSYPRSGSNFLWYLLHEIVGYRIDKCHLASQKEWLRNCRGAGGENTKFINAANIFLLRNYKECIPRQTNEYVFGDKFKDALKNKKPEGSDPSQHRFDYILLLDDFHNANQDKILIYYEDFMVKPKETEKKVLTFLASIGLVVNWAKFEEVFDNFDFHTEESIRKYTGIGAESQTKGKDLYFHSKKMTLEDRMQADQAIKSEYPILYSTYLKKRYAEKKYAKFTELVKGYFSKSK